MVADECETHLFLSPFFYVSLRLKSSIYCKIMKSLPKLVFCSDLMKRSKISKKSSKRDQKFKVVTSGEECCNIISKS